MLEYVTGAEGCGAFLKSSLKDVVAEAGAIGQVKDILSRFGVMVFSGQSISDDDFRDFSKSIGALRPVGRREARLPGHLDVSVIATESSSGGGYGISHVGTYWHTDLSYEAKPPDYTLLYCVESSESLGLTADFSNLRLAYDALPDSIRISSERWSAIHDLAMSDAPNFSGRNMHQPSPMKDRSKSIACHRLVKVHPRSNLRGLYFNPGLVSKVIDEDGCEVSGVLEYLNRHVVMDSFRCSHHW